MIGIFIAEDDKKDVNDKLYSTTAGFFEYYALRFCLTLCDKYFIMVHIINA